MDSDHWGEKKDDHARFLEKRYGFTIESHELTPANLDSLANINRFLTRKLSDQGGGKAAGTD